MGEGGWCGCGGREGIWEREDGVGVENRRVCVGDGTGVEDKSVYGRVCGRWAFGAGVWVWRV